MCVCIWQHQQFIALLLFYHYLTIWDKDRERHKTELYIEDTDTKILSMDTDLDRYQTNIKIQQSTIQQQKRKSNN